MKGGSKASSGFTIVEVLIVLAVSGALFIAAATMIAGKQRRTQFTTAANNARSQIEQVIREVETGYYANMGNFTCTATAGGPSITSGSTNQGENEGCIFMGKVIQFDLQGTNPEAFRVYPIAGLRQSSSGSPVASMAEARPKVIAGAGQNFTWQNGLTTESVRWGSGNTAIGSVAFVANLSAYGGGNATQQISLLPINNSIINDTAANAVTLIDNNIQSSTMGGGNGVRVCLVSAGTQQSAKITIGGNERQLTVKMEIKENTTCA